MYYHLTLQDVARFGCSKTKKTKKIDRSWTATDTNIDLLIFLNEQMDREVTKMY